jgi:hypothetical protein
VRRAALAAVALLLLAVLAAGHWYLARRLLLEPALPPPLRGTLVAALVALGASLVAQPAADRLGRRAVARALAWPAAVWMGLAFYLLVGCAVTDVVRLAVVGTALASGPALGGAASSWAGARAAVVALAATAAAAAGVRAALRPPAVRRVVVALARWPRALDGFRIVQVSDVHIGPLLDRRFAAAVVTRVNALAPDLVAVTGDLVDGSVAALADEVAPFAGLAARHGVFFVTGNHDYYYGADDWIACVERLGMRVLRNEHVTIHAGRAAFDLAGVDDRHARFFGPGHGEDVPRALAGRDSARAVVLLAHDPGTFKEAAALGVDLQLSGHTHGGQIWPFGWLVRLAVPWVAGRHRRGASELYVSRGTGFWGPPMRVGAPAEITEVVLRAAA